MNLSIENYLSLVSNSRVSSLVIGFESGSKSSLVSKCLCGDRRSMTSKCVSIRMLFTISIYDSLIFMYYDSASSVPIRCLNHIRDIFT